MKYKTKALLTAASVSFALCGNANAMIADLDNLPGIGPDFTLDMCERWDEEKRASFEDLFANVRNRIELKFPQKTFDRWNDKWELIEDWSKFPGNHRPFKGFHLKGHFHDCGDKEYCTPGDLNPPAAVPVPAAAWLFGSGLIALAGVARRKRT